MPLFEVSPDGLIPFRQMESGAGSYDEAIEDVLWRNLDGLVGERLFRVRRQAPLDGGGRPAVVALDTDGSVVVFHVRRQMDRSGLAECLEYAGWARAATLDELAMLYWRGESEFWTDWHGFAGGENRSVRPSPRLFLATGDFTARAQSTFEFLVDNGLPVKVMRAALYENQNGNRVLEVDGPSDVESVLKPSPAAEATFERLSRSARRNAERSADRALPQPAGLEATQVITDAPARNLGPGAIPGHVVDRGRGQEQPPSRAEARELDRAADAAMITRVDLGQRSQREIEPPVRRSADPLQDPLSGGLLPPPVTPVSPPPPVTPLPASAPPAMPTPLTAEQLRTDPLGMDQIVAGQLASGPEKSDQPTDPRGAAERTGPQGVLPAVEPSSGVPFHRGPQRGGPPAPGQPGLPPVGPPQGLPQGLPPVGPPPGGGHGLPPGFPAGPGQGLPPAGPPPGFPPGPPAGPPGGAPGPAGFGPAGPPPPPSGFGRPPQPDFESPLPDHPDVRQGPPRRGGFTPNLSVVPPVPEPGKDAEHHLEPPVGEAPEPDGERPERTRLSDIMDPRMLRVPDGLAWGDPRTANGKRENGHRDNGHRDNNGR